MFMVHAIFLTGFWCQLQYVYGTCNIFNRVLVNDREGGLYHCSEHAAFTPQGQGPLLGPLATLQANKGR